MILLLALAILCLAGVIGTIVASARDSHAPMRTVWGYDTRHPWP